jgi:hypothetical protein
LFIVFNHGSTLKLAYYGTGSGSDRMLHSTMEYR